MIEDKNTTIFQQRPRGVFLVVTVVALLGCECSLLVELNVGFFFFYKNSTTFEIFDV